MPQRVAVVGNSGPGKSPLAHELAKQLGAEYIELDAIHHLPDCVPIERDEMRRMVSERTRAERCEVDGNDGRMVGDIVLTRADTVVWLDLPRRVIMPRVIRPIWRGWTSPRRSSWSSG